MARSGWRGLIGPARAKELVWSGRQVRADEAHALGILDRVVGVDEVERNALHWAGELGTGAVVAMGLAKRVIDDGLGVPLALGLDAGGRRVRAGRSPRMMRASGWSRSSSTVPARRNSPGADRLSDRYELVSHQLQEIYDGVVERRAASPLEPWKLPERAAFLEILVREGRHSLLEIGAGTGVHGRFFADAGFEVVCTDLSAAMVEHCRAQGLTAVQQDFLQLDLGRTFDAVFAMNCLLHVPREDLPAVLTRIRSTLVDGGVFFLGQYGGIDQDGVLDDDSYEPKRYFSFLPDDVLLAIVGEQFSVESFRVVELDGDNSHFQSLVLRA